MQLSRHNVRCDELCGEAAEKHLASLENELSAMTNCPKCDALIKPQTLCETCADVHRINAKSLMSHARLNYFAKGKTDYAETDVA